MSATRGRGKTGARKPRAPALARPDRTRRQLFGAIALVLILGGAGAGIALWRKPRAAAPPAAETARDPAAGTSTIEAAGSAARLYRENRAYESLPFYRRVAPEMAPGRLDFRLEFATALQNASLQARIKSEERVRLMLECMVELALTERAMQRPRDRARVIVARAFFLRVWGFPADAAAELRRALATDPSYPDLAATARLFERRVREPTLSLDALDGPGLSF